MHATLALLDAGAPLPNDPTARQRGADVAAAPGPAVLRIELVLDERTLREVGRAIATAYDVVLSLAPGRAGPDGRTSGGPSADVVEGRVDPVQVGGQGERWRSGSVEIGELRVDFGAHEVWRGGRRVPLRPREFALLRALLRANGCAVSRECLLKEVWGYTDGVVSRTLDTHVRSLRRKLEPNPAVPRHLLTVRTVGYRFACS